MSYKCSHCEFDLTADVERLLEPYKAMAREAAKLVTRKNILDIWRDDERQGNYNHYADWINEANELLRLLGRQESKP